MLQGSSFKRSKTKLVQIESARQKSILFETQILFRSTGGPQLKDLASDESDKPTEQRSSAERTTPVENQTPNILGKQRLSVRFFSNGLLQVLCIR
jgi:hypothetical protein